MASGIYIRAYGQSKAGKEVAISIWREGWTGGVTVLPMGSSPVLRREGDRIQGTSLAFSLVAQSADQLVDLYTSDPRKYSVRFAYDGKILFDGYLTPELYSCEWNDAPYTVSLTATDGLGELKLSRWTETSDMTVDYALTLLLEETGQSLDTAPVCSLSIDPDDYTFLQDVYIHADVFEDKTCYEVLEALLETFNARICLMRQYGTGDLVWTLYRDTDLIGFLNTTSGVLRDCHGDRVTYMPESGSLRQDMPVWPVGTPRMEIVPAKREMTLLYEPDYRDRAMALDSFTVSSGAYLMDGAICIPPGGSATRSGINLGFYSPGYTPNVTLVLRCRQSQVNSSENAIGVRVTGYSRETGSLCYLSDGSYWGSFDNVIERTLKADDGTFSEVEIYVPRDCTISTVELTGTSSTASVYVAGVALRAEGPLESQTMDLRLNNGARSVESDVELSLISSPLYPRFDRRNMWIDDGSTARYDSYAPFLWYSSSMTAGEGLDTLIARDYALGFANPRLRLSGTWDMSAVDSRALFPLLVRNTDLQFLIEEISFDSMNDEWEMNMISLPASALEVESITAQYGSSGDQWIDVPNVDLTGFSKSASGRDFTVRASTATPVYVWTDQGKDYTSTWITVTVSETALGDYISYRIQVNVSANTSGKARTGAVVVNNVKRTVRQAG